VRHAPVATLVALFVLRCTPFQPPEAERTVPVNTIFVGFAEFDNTAAAIQARSLPVTLKQTCDRGISAYYTIRTIAKQSPQKAIPIRYVDSLQYDLHTLGRAASLRFITPAQEEMISYAALNIVTKAAQATAAPNKWADLIDVTVETVRGATPVPNLQIWYVPIAWWNVPDRWQRFPLPSTPTTEKLAPGNYLVAAKLANVNPVPMRVGGDGSSKLRFVLQVP